MMKKLAQAACAAVLVAAGSAGAEILQPFKPECLGQIVLPTGLKIAGVEFGGISGLDYDAANGLFYAVSDDRSQKAPARFYTLKLQIDATGVGGIDIVSSHALRGDDNAEFAAKSIDPEAIRFAAATKTIYWSSEGDAVGKPAIYEAAADGAFRRAFAIPDAYLPNDDATRGVRSNQSFEGLTISTDGTTLWAVTENALVQDGEAATLEAGSLSRLIGFDIESGTPVAEYAYETGPIFRKAQKEPYYNDNGLTEILAVGEGVFLMLERSYAHGIGNEINLYRAETEGATDITDMAALAGAAVEPLRKTHLLKIGEGDFGLDIDNVEALSHGPEIDGQPTLVLASDNNFNPDGQFTQFIVFKLAPVSN